MFPTQVVTAHRRMPASTALMVATGFALGALVGLGVQGALDRASGVGVGVASPVVTTQDMSGAAYAATHPALTPAAHEATFPAAAGANDMSAAAYAAMHPTRDMSSAAYAAMHPDLSGDR